MFSKMTSGRGALAAFIVALWLGGMAMMVRRNANHTESQQLSEVALRVQPATFYYVVERNGEQIGAASSSLDTTTSALVSEDYFVGEFPTPSAPAGPASTTQQRTSVRWQTRLTRGFRLADLSIDISRQSKPFSINAAVEEDTSLYVAGVRRKGGRPPARYTFAPPLFTPSTAAVAFMLSGPPTIGRAQRMSVFNPTTRTVMKPELRIKAESLFTVVDSAVLNASSQWEAAHRDTVRAWRIDSDQPGLTAWFDAAGRLVVAQFGDLSATRSAFEIAFKNVKAVDAPRKKRTNSK